MQSHIILLPGCMHTNKHSCRGSLQLPTQYAHTYHTHMWGFSPWYAHSDIIFTNASEPGIPNMAVVYALHWKWWLPLTLSGSYKSAICPVAVYGQNEMLDIISVRQSVCVTSLPNPVFRGFLPKPACTIPP